MVKGPCKSISKYFIRKTQRNPNPSPTGFGFGFLLFGAGERTGTFTEEPRREPDGGVTTVNGV